MEKYGKVRCDASIRQQTRSLPAVYGFVIDKVIPSYRIVPSCFLHQDITSSPRTICHPGSIWSIDLRNRSSSCSLERRKPSSTLSSIRTSCSSIRPSRPSCSSIRPQSQDLLVDPHHFSQLSNLILHSSQFFHHLQF